MLIVLKLSSAKPPDFFHTFTVNFALAPVVFSTSSSSILHSLQYGVINLEMVY